MDATPFDVEGIDDPLDQISQRPSSVETVGYSKGIEHADVSYVQRGGSIVEIDMGAPFWNMRYPRD